LRFANPSFEFVHRRHYSTRNAASRNIFAYIEGPSRTRRRSATGYISPIEMALKSSSTLSNFSEEDQGAAFPA
jgi:hypothetical protein